MILKRQEHSNSLQLEAPGPSPLGSTAAASQTGASKTLASAETRSEESSAALNPATLVSNSNKCIPERKIAHYPFPVPLLLAVDLFVKKGYRTLKKLQALGEESLYFRSESKQPGRAAKMANRCSRMTTSKIQGPRRGRGGRVQCCAEHEVSKYEMDVN